MIQFITKEKYFFNTYIVILKNKIFKLPKEGLTITLETIYDKIKKHLTNITFEILY